MKLLTYGASLAVRFYRMAVSPFLGNNCRFYPSCSCYAEQALEKKGFFKAVTLILFRILKCHPLNRGGFDPVE